jgi:hypothetical protein
LYSGVDYIDCFVVLCGL